MKKLGPNPRLIITLQRDRYQALKVFCQKNKIRMAEVVRRGIDRIMEEKKR